MHARMLSVVVFLPELSARGTRNKCRQISRAPGRCRRAWTELCQDQALTGRRAIYHARRGRGRATSPIGDSNKRAPRTRDRAMHDGSATCHFWRQRVTHCNPVSIVLTRDPYSLLDLSLIGPGSGGKSILDYGLRGPLI